jgi:hypothetical protein
MTVCLVISLQKKTYIHRIYMVLVNPTYVCSLQIDLAMRLMRAIVNTHKRGSKQAVCDDAEEAEAQAAVGGSRAQGK